MDRDDLNRALTRRLWQDRLSRLAVPALIFGAVASLFVLLPDDEPHIHDSYHTAQVTGFAVRQTDDSPPSYVLTTRLSDGRTFTVSTKSGALAGQVTDTACIELRKREKSGKLTARLANSTHCTPKAQP